MNSKKTLSPVRRLLREVRFHCRQRVKQVFHKFMSPRKETIVPMTQMEFDWHKETAPKQD